VGVGVGVGVDVCARACACACVCLSACTRANLRGMIGYRTHCGNMLY